MPPPGKAATGRAGVRIFKLEMWLHRLHGAVDSLAMWGEDLRRRSPAPFVASACDPLECFGPLPPLPRPPQGRGMWRAPSPLRSSLDPLMHVLAIPACEPRRGTTILVPPWKIPRLSLLSRWIGTMSRAGQEVWTLVPPRHLVRSPPGMRSGEAFVTPDLPALRSAMEQLVLELRTLLALAHGRSKAVALVGLSLGGLGAALAATAPEAPDRAALIAPPADLQSVVASTRIGRRLSALSSRAGQALPAAAELSPMLWPFRADGRALRAGRALVGVGIADGVAPPAPARALAAAWDAELRVYPRGHLTLLFACHALLRDVGAFISG